jgi:hypothetical protein
MLGNIHGPSEREGLSQLFSVAEAFDLKNIGEGLNGLCSDGVFLYAVFASGEAVKINPTSGDCVQRNLSKRYNLEQPVSLSVFGAYLYISDWHNHRIVKLTKSFGYVASYGYYWQENLTKTVRSLLTRHRVILSHRSISFGSFPKTSRFKKLMYLLRKIISTDKLMISKPNGCFFSNDKVFVVSKNNRCLILCDYNFQPISQVSDASLDRLGTVSQVSSMPIFCDEQNSRLFVFLDSGALSFFEAKLRPFAAVKLAEGETISVGNDGIEVLNSEMETIFTTTNETDLHCITVCNGEVFVGQRETGKIFKVTNA